MAKLIRILAASLGGGLVLGAGIRLGERLVSASGDTPDSTAGALSERLEQLEGRLSHLEVSGGADPTRGAGIDLGGIESRIEAQAAEVSAVRVRMEAGTRQAAIQDRTDEQLRTELRGMVEERLEERLRGVETRLRAENDAAQREMLNAVMESVQTRVIVRISRLEEEVAGQASGMQELRACTLRTEQSMQKLLSGIDRLIAAQPVARPNEASFRAPETTREYDANSEAKREADLAQPDPPQAPEQTASAATTLAPGGFLSGDATRKRRWSIFG